MKLAFSIRHPAFGDERVLLSETKWDSRLRGSDGSFLNQNKKLVMPAQAGIPFVL